MSDVTTALAIVSAAGLLVLGMSAKTKTDLEQAYPKQNLYMVAGHRNSVGYLLTRGSGVNRKISTPRTSRVRRRDGYRVAVNTTGRMGEANDRLSLYGSIGSAV
jgi:hypothetical protein